MHSWHEALNGNLVFVDVAQPSPPPPASAPSNSSSSGLGTGALVGIVIGAICGLLLIALVAWGIMHNYRVCRAESTPDERESSPDSDLKMAGRRMKSPLAVHELAMKTEALKAMMPDVPWMEWEIVEDDFSIDLDDDGNEFVIGSGGYGNVRVQRPKCCLID